MPGVRRLTLRLFGGYFAALDDGTSVEVSARKTQALLAYLAITGKACSRATIATLLWGDMSREEQARRSLRQALTGLRRSLPEGLVTANRDAIKVASQRIDLDVDAFRAALSRGDQEGLRRAVGLFAGDFLEGFTARAEPFDEWVDAERRRLRSLALEAMQRLVHLQREAGEPDQAQATAMRLVALDPLRETAHRDLMSLYASDGRRAEALRQYEECREILARELNVGPSAETQALAERIAKSESPTRRHVAAEQLALRHTCVIHASESVGTFGTEAAAAYLTRLGGYVHRRNSTSVTAVFGALPGQTGYVERAVSAALEVEREATRLGSGVRVGVASGQLLVDGSVKPHAIHGDALRCAAALARGAPGVIASRAVYDVLAPRLVAQPLPAEHAYRVENLAPKLPSSSAPRLVGRRFELAQVLAALDLCEELRRGHCFLIRGEAGIGKTRLALAVREAVERRGWSVHVQVFSEFGDTTSEGPLEQLLTGLLGLDSNPSEERVNAVLDSIVQAGELRPEDRSPLRSMFRFTRERQLLHPIDEAVAARRKGLIAQLAESKARHGPLLIWLEDVHWADGAACDQIVELIDRTHRAAWILLLTWRSDEGNLPARLLSAGRTGISTLQLGPLDAAESRELAEWLGGAGDASLIERAGGNPLFLTELLRFGTHEGVVPESIQSLVQVRLDQLPPTLKSAAQTAAVLGFKASRSAFESIDAGDNSNLEGLQGAGLLEQSGPDFVFVHSLVQEAIYRALVPERKRHLHLSAARYFAGRDPILHARHLERAESGQAATAYAQAAELELRTGAPERALNLCESGLELVSEIGERETLSCLRGEILRAQGKIEESLEIFSGVFKTTTDPVRRFRAQLGTAEALRAADRQYEALDTLELAERSARERGSESDLAEVEYQRGSVLFPLGDIEGSLRAHTSSLTHARRAGARHVEVKATSGIADAHYAAGRLVSSREAFARTAALAQEHDLPDLLVSSEGMLAVIDIFDKNLHQGFESCLSMAERASSLGALRSECFCRASACLALVFLNADERLVEEGKRGVAFASSIGAPRFEAVLRAYLAIGLARVGRRTEGSAELARARELAQSSGMAYSAGAVFSAALALAVDPAERIDAIQRGYRAVQSGALVHSWFLFAESAMVTAIEMKDFGRVRALADELAARASDESGALIDLVVAAGRASARAGSGESLDGPAQLAAIHDRLVNVGFMSLAAAIAEAFRIEEQVRAAGER